MTLLPFALLAVLNYKLYTAIKELITLSFTIRESEKYCIILEFSAESCNISIFFSRTLGRETKRQLGDKSETTRLKSYKINYDVLRKYCTKKTAEAVALQPISTKIEHQ